MVTEASILTMLVVLFAKQNRQNITPPLGLSFLRKKDHECFKVVPHTCSHCKAWTIWPTLVLDLKVNRPKNRVQSHVDG